MESCDVLVVQYSIDGVSVWFSLAMCSEIMVVCLNKRYEANRRWITIRLLYAGEDIS